MGECVSLASCEILCVGTELLLGDTLNTNARFLSRELADAGFTLHRQAVVGDNPERLHRDFLTAWERSDFVILTGGLGPTADDITRETVCGALGIELVESPELLEAMQTFFCIRSLEMPKSNRRQAMVPVNAELIMQNSEFSERLSQKRDVINNSAFVFPNPHGTAPGIAITQNGKCAILLPGPPSEMEPMFRQSVRNFLAPWIDGILISHEVRTMGIGESAMAEAVADLLDGQNPSVAPYAKSGEALLRITAKAKTREEAEVLIAPVLEEIKRRLGGFIYGVDVPNVETVLLDKLCKAGKTLCTAESITGGGIAKRLTDCPGASKILLGSIVAYCNEMKQGLLGVSAKTLQENGAVSEQCAIEMAQGARKKIGTDFAISTTGYADGNEQLRANVALDSEAGTQVQHITFARNNRKANKLTAENTALWLLMQNI